MRKIIAVLAIAILPGFALASGGEGYPLARAHNDLHDQASLRRGAKLFVNYCMGCHSLAYMRYNRIGKDLEISGELLKKDLMFGADKVGSTMDIAMDADDAGTWFGTAPPDLSVIARARGVDWLYTYLTAFYQDDSRPFGVNNAVFPDVGMPHALWELQGLQKAVYKEVEADDGTAHEVIEGFEPVRPGSMDEPTYKHAVRDLVNFLDYTGEPAKTERQRLGKWVLLFLIFFFFVAYALKKEYWRDVH